MSNIYVEGFFGGEASIGQIVAEVGMTSNYGTIMGISGDLIQVGSGNNETQAYVYNFQVCIGSGAAGARYSWPTGVNCFPSSHNYVWPNGDVFNPIHATGMVMSKGSNDFTIFGR